MKGHEIAKKLNISTSALKHYETWGLIPEVERAENGYRNYTAEHEAYFECIRALKSGFGMDLVKEIMPRIILGEKLEVLWLINKAQVNLHTEKLIVQRTVDMLDLRELSDFPSYGGTQVLTIGEAAKEANISPSAIRHWEKEGLITSERHKESGFRLYTPADLRKILIIRTIQRVVYSLDIVREVLSDLDKNNIAQAKEIALKSLQYLDYALVEQLRGVSHLQKLFDTIANNPITSV
ncbi:MerR family transcriptional regulator [Paenibacillus sp. strain BS8-2]